MSADDEVRQPGDDAPVLGQRTKDLINQSRNERQKSSLLTHLAALRMGPEATAMGGNSGISLEDLRTQRVRFLRTELELGLTFASIALQKNGSAEKKQRNWVNARKAYDTVIRSLENSTLTSDEAQGLESRLSNLKAHLVTLGDTL